MKRNAIEERAREYSNRNFDGFFTGLESSEERAYIKGATEQRKADIEKACEWLKENYWTCASRDEYVNDFRKYMEE